MNRHLLLTVSGEQSALHGVRFVGEFFQDKQNLDLTLFYTAARPYEPEKEMPSFEERAEYEKLRNERERKGKQALAQARQVLRGLGFTNEQIHDKLNFRRLSKALDIIQEGEQGFYDAVVLGRRGVGWLEEVVDGSVSRAVLDTACTFPFWIVRRPEKSDSTRKNVLVCVDDSEHAYRVVDHVGFILAGQPAHDITLLNVYDPRSGDRIFAEQVFNRCREILESNDMPPDRVHAKVAESFQAGKAILRVAEKGAYAAVAMGRKGEDRGMVRRMFMGSTSTALYQSLTGAALWLCQ